jgi:hypothetical protein
LIKKIFFCAVLGMVSAKDITITKKVKEMKKITLVEKNALKLPAQWVECSSPCGEVYWLQASNYDTVSDLLDAEQELNDIKCN